MEAQVRMPLKIISKPFGPHGRSWWGFGVSRIELDDWRRRRWPGYKYAVHFELSLGKKWGSDGFNERIKVTRAYGFILMYGTPDPIIEEDEDTDGEDYE
jgi:hypothetical protein